MPKLSIVIPVLNEERYLPVLLHSLNTQTFKDFEVIVVDSFSKDLTPRIAALYGVRLVQCSGRVSESRNAGALVAVAPHLLFLDADVQFPDSGWLCRFMKFVDENGIRLAHVYSIPDSHDVMSKIYIGVRNLWVWSTMNTLGWFIFVDKDIFLKAGKFNERARIAEDGLFGRNANKYCDLWLFHEAIITSMRRYKKEGFFKNAGLLMKCTECYEKGDFSCDDCAVGRRSDYYRTGEFL